MDLPDIEDIKRIDLRPGDVIVVRFKERLTSERADNLRNRLGAEFAPAKVVILDSAASVDVLNEAELGGWV